MSQIEKNLRSKIVTGIATVTLALSQGACNGPVNKIDPCDEAFQALTTAFIGTRPGVIGDNIINVWPANADGSASHPRVDWGVKSNASWREVASYIRFNCQDTYEVKSFAPDQEEEFYDHGVQIGKRVQPAHNISLPETASTPFLTYLAGLGVLATGAWCMFRRKPARA